MVRVLVADNSRLVRNGLRAALAADHDIEVVGEAEDGQSALRLAHQLRPDVLLLDLLIGCVSGLEVLRTLAPVLPRIHIVAFGRDARLRDAALRDGAASFVSKDAAPEILLREIRCVAHGAPAETRSAREPLGERLVEDGVITDAELDAALIWQRALEERGQPRRLGDLLRELGFVTADVDPAVGQLSSAPRR